MTMENKLMRLLLGPAKKRIVPLHGTGRRLVDALMARGAAATLTGYFRKRGTPPADALSAVRRQLRLASIVRYNKYIYFNGSVFIDCFAPKWPGRAASKAVEVMMDNALQDEDDWVPYVPGLVFSITKKCVYRCEHCYAIKTLGGKDVFSAEQLLKTAKDFQEIGVGVIAWEGGEPLLRFEDLLMLIRETSDKSESLLATTAYGMTDDMAARLSEAGLVSAIISLDHYEPDRHNAFRGNKKAFDMAVNGVRIFRENGVLPSIAICATRETVDEGGLYRYIELAKDIGAAFVQVLDATPSGNYLGKNVSLTRSQMEEIKKFHVKVNTHPRYRDYPAVQARAFLEDPDNMGCCAGNALVYIDSSGNMQPCDLLQISLGNVLEEGVEPVYSRLKRCFPHPTAGRCPAQTLHRRILRVHEETGKLPLDYTDCEDILDRIKDRGLPEKIKSAGR